MSTVKRMNQCFAYHCEADAFANFNGNGYCFQHIRQLMNVNPEYIDKLKREQQQLSNIQLDEEPEVCLNCSA